MDTDPTPRAVILDDGELDEVRGVLTDLGVPFGEGDSALKDGRVASVPILFTTPRHALALGSKREVAGGLLRSFHVVCHDGASRTLRQLLKRIHADFVARRPLHPTVLRFLIQRVLFEGAERRSCERVAVGAPVKVRIGWRTRAVTLVDLSVRGCGLAADADLEAGTALRVVLSHGLTGDGSLVLGGQVVASSRRPNGGSGRCELAVAFGSINAKARRTLREVIRRHGIVVGPPAATEARPNFSKPSSTERTDSMHDRKTATRSSRGTGERRSLPRKAYAHKILAANDGKARGLMSSDLSLRGMRVEADDSLALGDELKLALYGGGSLEPVMVKAVVARDDGEDGWMLHFSELGRATAAKLSELIDSLPDVGSDLGPGRIISEIVEQD